MELTPVALSPVGYLTLVGCEWVDSPDQSEIPDASDASEGAGQV